MYIGLPDLILLFSTLFFTVIYFSIVSYFLP